MGAFTANCIKLSFFSSPNLRNLLHCKMFFLLEMMQKSSKIITVLAGRTHFFASLTHLNKHIHITFTSFHIIFISVSYSYSYHFASFHIALLTYLIPHLFFSPKKHVFSTNSARQHTCPTGCPDEAVGSVEGPPPRT